MLIKLGVLTFMVGLKDGALFGKGGILLLKEGTLLLIRGILLSKDGSWLPN